MSFQDESVEAPTGCRAHYLLAESRLLLWPLQATQLLE